MKFYESPLRQAEEPHETVDDTVIETAVAEVIISDHDSAAELEYQLWLQEEKGI